LSDSLFKRPSSEVKMLRTPILLDGILRLFFAEINGWNKTKKTFLIMSSAILIILTHVGSIHIYPKKRKGRLIYFFGLDNAIRSMGCPLFSFGKEILVLVVF
jgi:hypothetical protein